MGKLRGVKPETVQLDLTEGDWIRVRKSLTVGEERAITSAAIRGYSDGGQRVEMDPLRLRFATAATYVTAWSLLNLDGQPIEWWANKSLDQKIDVLKTLDTATMREIDDAIAAHRVTVQGESEKNAPTTGTGSEASSPSAS